MEEYQTIKVKYDHGSQACHHLFYKKHKLGKSDSNDLSSRTLFVSNIPPYYTEQGLKNVFGAFGKVERAQICSKPTPNPFESLENNNKKSYFDQEDKEEINCFKVAYVVFTQKQSLEKSLKKPIDNERILNKEDNISTGMKKWIEEYRKNFVDAKLLNKEIDDFMKSYDADQEKKEKEELENLNQPDEDGWITVTTKSRKSNKTFTEKNIEKIKTKQTKKRQKMQLINFYSFQIKESKKEYIAQLRTKFEEDKKRIEAMKQSRKFKPF
ncbi:ribosomal RNA-processing 7 -like protein [Brachionus plicatilis]|uniref:Ribosomal RNA-processing 7-like protein n=1 Tax=Brachionus plicatilis TaxID=10195 RepID=A0A3M7SCH1_BRAPC|nr:ribosomal RNA-processing 7 -like protein [Brachionus plicatilis]